MDIWLHNKGLKDWQLIKSNLNSLTIGISLPNGGNNITFILLISIALRSLEQTKQKHCFHASFRLYDSKQSPIVYAGIVKDSVQNNDLRLCDKLLETKSLKIKLASVKN